MLFWWELYWIGVVQMEMQGSNKLYGLAILKMVCKSFVCWPITQLPILWKLYGKLSIFIWNWGRNILPYTVSIQFLVLSQLSSILSTVFLISKEVASTGDGLCTICHEFLSTTKPTTELPCNHLFHTRCICKWFFSQLSCPLCIYDFKKLS